EKQAVVEYKNEGREKECRSPLTSRRRALASNAHPRIEDNSGDEEAHCGEEKGRDFAHADADGEKRGTPNEVNHGKDEQRFRGGALARKSHESSLAKAGQRCRCRQSKVDSVARCNLDGDTKPSHCWV